MKAIYENHYLDDNAVANYARLSFSQYAKNFTTEDNNRLVRFLARGCTAKDYNDLVRDVAKGVGNEEVAKEVLHRWRSTPEHWVPFGHPHITLRVSAPVPIRTQCYKHKIGMVESEESRRYIKSRPVLYIPEYFRATAENVKQGSSDEPHQRDSHWMEKYTIKATEMIDLFEEAIADGICPEQARFFLPQGVEVNWVWTGSLYAFANFYVQRSDHHAQKEIRVLAEQVSEIIEPLFPVSWAALTRAEY